MSTDTEGKTFDPSKHLRKLGGKDYLEVKWRLVWLRTEHPEARIRTNLEQIAEGFALFSAVVEIPGAGVATGYGSETSRDFGDFIEKAETKAIGRALAALGYGTQFCEDMEMLNPDGTPHVVDSPVDVPRGPSPSGIARPAPKPAGSESNLATPAQLKLIYLTATRDLHISEEELEEKCQERFGRLPLHLTKREASEFIDWLKGGAV